MAGFNVFPKSPDFSAFSNLMITTVVDNIKLLLNLLSLHICYSQTLMKYYLLFPVFHYRERSETINPLGLGPAPFATQHGCFCSRMEK